MWSQMYMYRSYEVQLHVNNRKFNVRRTIRVRIPTAVGANWILVVCVAKLCCLDNGLPDARELESIQRLGTRSVIEFQTQVTGAP